MLRLPAAAVLLNAATREATFYIMNTSRNRNRWGVSEKALAEGAPTIKGKPIGCGKGYKIDDHYPEGENMDVGQFTSYDIPSSYMTAKAKIDDDKVWGFLEAKEWGPISIVIWPYEANCTGCGEDVLKSIDAKGLFQHDHILEGKAYAQVESFKFDRLDFVDDPAYPQAGILDMDASAEDITQAIMLVASYSNGGANGGANPGGIEKKVTDKTPEELQEELDEKLKQIETLETKVKEVETLEAKVKELEEAAAAATDDDKDEVTKRLEALETRGTQVLIDRAAEARFKAGLVEDLEEERERLKDFPQAYLMTMTLDAEAVAEKLKSVKKRAPKAGYDEPDDITGFDAAFKAVKARVIPEAFHQILVARSQAENQRSDS